MKKNHPADPLYANADGAAGDPAADAGFDVFVHTGAPADLGPAVPPAGLDLQHIGIVAADAIAPAPGARVEVVFIEQNVTDLDGMLKAIGGGREVHVLDAARDGLQQMAQILAGRSGIDAIHLVTHGADASLSLGSLTLSADNTDAHAADLQAIGRSMTDGGDIMLYGCDVAAGADGAAWLDRLAIVTGADVAASSNLTGSAELGGDWTLEVSSGHIETASVVAPDMAKLYHSVLAISQNVAFANTFASVGDNYQPSGDVIYNVQGNTAYQLKFDGAVGGVSNAAYGGRTFVVANYNSAWAETAVTLSFQAGQLFTIGTIGLTNLYIQTGSTNATQLAQDLVFKGYDASSHLVATQNITLLADSANSAIQSFTLAGMTEIATLKIVSINNGNLVKALEIDSLALSNIHAAVADTTPPVAPSTPALASGSDTGTSLTDNLTKTATPTFEGTAEANSTVKLYADGGVTAIATTTANGSGAWSVATSALSQGVHSITATATDAANNVGPASAALSVTIDTTAPTLAITRSASTLKSGETATITFTFSEDPGSTFAWNGSTGDVTVTGGTLGAISGTGTTRTATFTPNASTNAGSASISVAAGTYTDAAGNNGGAGSAVAISYDTLAPAVSTPVLDSASDSGISSSDAITTILAPTLTGTAETGATVRLYETDGTTLLGTAVATGGNWSITTGTLAAGAHSFKATATDATGNVSALSSGLAVTIDTTAPTLAITSSVATLKAGDTATITFTFSEDPGTGFAWNGSSGSVTVTGGTLGAISGTGTTRTATFTPTASTNAGTASISVAASAYTDKAGNAGGAGSAPSLTFDTLAPAVSTPLLASASDSGVSSSDAITNILTPTLTGSAEAGATVSLYETDGTTLLGTAVATGGAWSITTGTLAAGAHAFKATATDAAGNVSALSSGLAVTIDTTAPTLAITSNVSTLKVGDTATITFTFSEDPGAGFAWNGSSGAVTVTGGTLGAIAGTGTTRTATFTPTAGVDAGSASISVAASAYTDKAGNAGGAGAPVTLSYDTLAPTAPSTPDLADASDSGISNSDNITNITTPVFNGTGTAGDTVTLYDSNGTTVLGSTVITGGGTWSITSSTLGSGIHQITAKTSDAAGNVSTSSALSVDIATAPPTLAITSSAATLNGSQTATITFTFSSDPGASFTWDGTAGDVTVSGGTLGAISGSGLTRTAVFTPTAGVNSGSASITVAAGTYTDAVSNSGGAGTSPSLTFDTLAPTAPATPTLSSGSDSGASNSDGITSVTTPTVTGTAEAGALVTLYDSNGTTVLGTVTADGSGNWSITSSALVAGVHSLTVKQTDTAGNVSPASLPQSVTVDNVAPTAIALSATTASDAGAVAGASLATLSATDTQAISYSLVAGSAGNDASNALFTIVGNTLKPVANLAVGTYQLYISATDAAGNHAEQPFTFTVNSGPSVSSIVRADSVATVVATSATSVTYTVTFSETVTAVDPTDFSLVTTGNASGTIAGITGSGSVYTVTVNALAGDGTLGLNLNGSGTGIQNGASAAITGGFTGQVLTLDHTAAAAPGGLAMTSATDTGTSSSDGITSNTAPVFTGTAEADALITLYDSDGTTVLGTATANGSGNWSVTNATLTPGSHSLTVKQADAAGNVSAASAPLPVSILASAPTLAITSNLPLLKAGQSATITFTFSADPGTSFAWDGTTGDVVVAGGTLGAISGSGLTRTATFTPTASTNAGTASITVAAGTYSDLAGNNGGGATTPALSFDTLAPAAPSAPDLTDASDNGVSSNDNITSITTPTFSGTAEAGATVRLLDTDGVTVLGSAVATGGNWSITSSALAVGSHVISAVANDAAGNASPVSTALPVQIVPAILPTVAIASDLAQLKIGQSAQVTFTFSIDPGLSFGSNSLNVTGGTLGAMSGSGLTRSATFTPTAGVDNGSANITVVANTYNGNGVLGSGASLNLGYDTRAPGASSTPDLVSDSDSGTSNSDNITSVTTPTFSGTAEAGATVTLYDSDGTTVLGSTVAAGGAWSIATSTLGAGVHNISARVTDAAGNVGAASAALPVTIMTAAPTLAITSNVAQLKAGQSATVTFTFSTDPGASFTWDGAAGDVVVTGGTLGAISGSGLTRSAIFTPTASVDAGTAGITVAAGTYADAAGNSGGGGTTPAISFDTLPPGAASTPRLAADSDSGSSASDGITNVVTPTLTGSAENGATVTLIDSDGVTILGSAVVANGQWSITSSALAQGSHAVTARIVDAAGNAGPVSAALALEIDTTAPTVAISSNVAQLSTGGSAIIVFRFSEDPGAGFGVGNITVTGGTLGPLSGTGLTRAARFTPTADLNDGTASITLATGAFHDVAGNANTAAASATLRYDTLTPAAPSAPALAAGSDTGVSSSDRITGIASPTLTGSAENGTTVTLYDSDGVTVLGTAVAAGGSWSITTGTLAQGVHNITAVATDAAGNVSPSSSALALTIDTQAPAASSAPHLAPGSDNGASASDNLTSVRTPVFTGTAEDGAIVTLVDSDGATLGTTVVSGGAWSITSIALAPGAHSVRALTGDVAGNSAAPSAALQLTIADAAVTTAVTGVTLSSDSGVSQHDFLTNVAAQTVAGTLGAPLAAGEFVQVSFDNGANWTRAAALPGAAAWSVDGTLVPGSGTLLVQVANEFGGKGPAYSQVYLLDTSAPPSSSVPVLSPASDNGASDSDRVTSIATPVLTGTAESGAVVTLVDSDGVTVLGTTVAVGGAWSITSSTLAPGLHSVRALVSDASGNSAVPSAPLELTIASAVTTTAVTGMALSADSGMSNRDFITNVAAQTVSGTLGAPLAAGEFVQVSFDNGATWTRAVAANGAAAWSAAGALTQGGGTLLVQVVNQFGGTGPLASQAYVLDTQAPLASAAPRLAGASDSGDSNSDGITNVTTPQLSGNAEAGVQVTLFDSDGATVLGNTTAGADGSWSIVSSTLGDGAHALSVRQTDAAGNQSAPGAALQVRIIGSAPTPSAPVLNAASDSGAPGDGVTTVTNPVINGVAAANALIKLYDGASLLGTAQADGAGAWSIAAPTLASGLHPLTVVQSDVAGNVSASSATFMLSIALPPTTVDGVPVSQAPVVLPGGTSGTAVEVPVILPDRSNSTGPTAVADIPLAVTPATGNSGGDTSTLLLAQLPTGLGLSASGGTSAPADDPLEHLIKAIVASTPNNAPADQTHLTDNGRNYLSKLPSAVPLLVETVTPTSGAGANGSATLTLTGTVSDSQHTALVIDASNLGAGNSIVLQSVDFAAVIGTASVTGNTSGQILTGDAAGQQFTVGAGSASSVFAGGGDDTLVFGLPAQQGGHGLGAPVSGAASGASVTTLHGGLAADTAAFAGARSDYKVELHDGYIVVSALAAPLSQAMLINVETLKFGDATLAVQNRAELGTIAGLYQDVLGRQADVLGFEYWGNMQAKGATLGQIALDMMLTPEGAARHAALNGTAAHDVAILYQSIFGRAADAGGLTFWIDAMQSKQVTLLQVADGFMQSAEIVGHNKAAIAWDFQV